MSRHSETSTYSTAPTLAETEQVFAALAHETRRHIVQMLAHLGDELPSGYLAKKFSASWPTITRHLNVLVDARVLEVRREGRQSFYRLDRDRLQRVVGGWLVLLAPPTPAATWRSSGRRTLKKG